jgi:accessory gene regulator protein AgrB
MACAGLFGSYHVLHSQLCKLQPVTEFSLIRWASKKAGQFLYYVYLRNSCIVHVLVWNIFPVMFAEVLSRCGKNLDKRR